MKFAALALVLMIAMAGCKKDTTASANDTIASAKAWFSSDSPKQSEAVEAPPVVEPPLRKGDEVYPAMKIIWRNGNETVIVNDQRRTWNQLIVEYAGENNTDYHKLVMHRFYALQGDTWVCMNVLGLPPNQQRIPLRKGEVPPK